MEVLILYQVPEDDISPDYDLGRDAFRFKEHCDKKNVTLLNFFMSPFVANVFDQESLARSPVVYKCFMTLEGEEDNIKEVLSWWQELAFHEKSQVTIQTVHEDSTWLEEFILLKSGPLNIPISTMSIVELMELFSRAYKINKYSILALLRNPGLNLTNEFFKEVRRTGIGWILSYPVTAALADPDPNRIFNLYYREGVQAEASLDIKGVCYSKEEFTKRTLSQIFPEKSFKKCCYEYWLF